MDRPGPTPLWATSTLRHPGSAAAHQFQAAQGAEGLSHVQAETQGEHGGITSVPMSPWSPIWENHWGNFWPRMLSADLISMDKKNRRLFQQPPNEKLLFLSPFEEWFRILHGYIVLAPCFWQIEATQSNSLWWKIAGKYIYIYISFHLIQFSPRFHTEDHSVLGFCWFSLPIPHSITFNSQFTRKIGFWPQPHWLMNLWAQKTRTLCRG